MTIEEIENLIKERDYYKKMYLEFNNFFLDSKETNTEAILKDLEKRYEIYADNTCLHCGEGKPAYCEKCFQELIARDLKRQNKA